MMQKKVLVLAVAAAIAAPAAFADTGNVTIYGLAHMAFQSTDNGSSSKPMYSIARNAMFAIPKRDACVASASLMPSADGAPCRK